MREIRICLNVWFCSPSFKIEKKNHPRSTESVPSACPVVVSPTSYISAPRRRGNQSRTTGRSQAVPGNLAGGQKERSRRRRCGAVVGDAIRPPTSNYHRIGIARCSPRGGTCCRPPVLSPQMLTTSDRLSSSKPPGRGSPP